MGEKEKKLLQSNSNDTNSSSNDIVIDCKDRDSIINTVVEPASESTPELELPALASVDGNEGVELESSTSTYDSDEKNERQDALDLLQRAMRGSIGRGRAEAERAKIVEEKVKTGL